MKFTPLPKLLTLLLVVTLAFSLAQFNCRLIRFGHQLYLLTNPLKPPCQLVSDPYSPLSLSLISPFLSEVISEYSLDLFADGLTITAQSSSSRQTVNSLTFDSGSNPPVPSAASELSPQTIQAVTENYPLADYFPYISDSMIANYLEDPKILYVNAGKLTQAEVEAELASYLRSQGISANFLQGHGVEIRLTKSRSVLN